MIARPYCGRENEDDAVTCQGCGTAVERGGKVADNAESTMRIFILALLFTIGLSTACLIVALVTHFYPLLLLLFPGMPFWGTIDAARIRRRYIPDSSCWPSGALSGASPPRG